MKYLLLRLNNHHQNSQELNVSFTIEARKFKTDRPQLYFRELTLRQMKPMKKTFHRIEIQMKRQID